MRILEIQAVAGALVVHALLAGGVFYAPAYVRSRPQVIEFDVKKKQPPPPPQKIIEPPPPPKVEPPPPPPPKKVKVPKPPEEAKAPIPNKEPPKEPPKDPPKDPPKPVFGVNMDSTTTGDSSFSVPVGNTTVADPKRTAPLSEVKPLPAAPPGAAPAPVFKPASPLEIKDYPEPDSASCQPPERYFPDELREQGIEGETQLRVQISESGKVVGVKVLRGPHKTLDELAVKWMQNRCRFSPARNTAGKPVPAAITYTFKWELAR